MRSFLTSHQIKDARKLVKARGAVKNKSHSAPPPPLPSFQRSPSVVIEVKKAKAKGNIRRPTPNTTKKNGRALIAALSVPRSTIAVLRALTLGAT